MSVAVAVVLPRGLHFSVYRASLIDLSAHDLILHSRHRDGTIVIGQASGDPRPGVRFSEIEAGGSRGRLSAIAGIIRRERAQAVLVHQHLPDAAALADLIAPVPVLLHRHNYERLSGNVIRRWWKRRRFSRLSRLFFVSEAARDHFSNLWPQGPRADVGNGLDISAWRLGDKRRREILVVGRAVGVNGILPAALGLEQALQGLPGWQATFVLSATREEPDYFREVAQVVARTPRTRLLVDQPFSLVKSITEEADIAIVPSVWSDPFGRTAREVLADGAALITSGRGGLREVAGDAADYLSDVDPFEIFASLTTLASSTDRRRDLQVKGRARAAHLFDIRACAARLDGLMKSAVMGVA
jgi:glycosyltransferase involved in cell wall biosynthesis